MEILGIDVPTAVAGGVLGTFLTLSGWKGAQIVRGWFKPKPG